MSNCLISNENIKLTDKPTFGVWCEFKNDGWSGYYHWNILL